MSSDFKILVQTLRKLGKIEKTIPKYQNGKDSKFKGSLISQIGEREINLGLLHYPWNRSVGVDKINQAYHFSNKTDLDGAFIVATTFSQSAIDLAFRINQKCDKRIVLIESKELEYFETQNSLNIQEKFIQ